MTGPSQLGTRSGVMPAPAPLRSAALPVPAAGSTARDPESRRRFLDQAHDLDQQARTAAERGDLASSARAILEALDCERRAGGVGPQVLQLIKPRN